MAHGDAREEKWRGNERMEWVTSKRHMTAEHRLARAVQTLQADAHSSPASSRLNWHPCPFKWTCPFCRKTKSGYCACAITFQTQCTTVGVLIHYFVIMQFSILFKTESLSPLTMNILLCILITVDNSELQFSLPSKKNVNGLRSCFKYRVHCLYNCTVKTIQVHINWCKCLSCFILIFFSPAGLSWGNWCLQIFCYEISKVYTRSCKTDFC